MKIAYDKKTDSLYIHLSDLPSEESEEVSSDVIMDYDKFGNPVGIDIQNASSHADIDEITISNIPSKAA